MKPASFRGGARIGWSNATWPFAKLVADAQELRLSCLGTYVFKPTDVVSLDPHGSIPFFHSGIRIRHNRPDYPATIIFWCLGRRHRTLEQLAASGFRPAGQAGEPARGMPVRWGAIILAVLLWNALFLFNDRLLVQGRPGLLMLSALLLFLVGATAIRRSARVQRLVLREGRHLGEIEAFLIVTQMILGALFLMFSLLFVAGKLGTQADGARHVRHPDPAVHAQAALHQPHTAVTPMVAADARFNLAWLDERPSQRCRAAPAAAQVASPVTPAAPA